MITVEDTTLFYFPGSGQRLRLSCIELIQSDCEAEGDPHEEIKNGKEDLPDEGAGFEAFIGVEINDHPYSEMISESDYSFEVIVKEPSISCKGRQSLEESILMKAGPLFSVRREQVRPELKAKVVTDCLFRRFSVIKTAENADLLPSQVRNILHEYKCLKKTTKTVQKSFNNRRPKIKAHHLDMIDEFIRERNLLGFTRVDIRAHLLSKSDDLESISKSCISNLLRKDLGLSYKKLGGTNVKKVRPEAKANLSQCLRLLVELILRRWHLVFLDEFTINRKTERTYGWTERGKPGRKLIRSPNFKMSFMIAHSSLCVEGVIGTSKTFDQIKYKYFLSQLLSKLKTDRSQDWVKIALVADNCRFHRTKDVKNYLRSEGVRCIFIPPYSPEINPCEKLINFIKSKVKAMVDSQA